MSLMLCPDCGHEVSTTATTCPNCAHPFVAPVVTPALHRNVIIENTPTENEGLPTWAYVIFGIIGVGLIFGVIVFMTRNKDDELANRNINVNIAAKRNTIETQKTPTQTVNVPTATDSQTVTVQTTPSMPSTVTTVPSSSTSSTTIVPVASDKGNVTIDAKISTAKGDVQSVKAEKFYLLDKSLDSILSDAKLEPIEGQTLINSFGLSVLFPSRYSEFNRNALNAIKSHIKYNVLTDSNGKAQMKDVKPDSYYLFGVTKANNAFAVWDSPVTIQTGQNVLSLSPQKLTEVEKQVEEDE